MITFATGWGNKAWVIALGGDRADEFRGVEDADWNAGGAPHLTGGPHGFQGANSGGVGCGEGVGDEFKKI
jgi:hypothetical protein